MVTLYIVRHGKTMFNTIGRAQGWSDTPLTQEGEAGIHALGRGLRAAGLTFDRAYSSDSGLAIQTLGIILEETGLEGQIPVAYEKQIREWCFGSFDGAYGGELFRGVIPRVLDTDNYKDLTLAELADGIYEVDSAGWAEPWSVLSKRIVDGFTKIAEEVQAAGQESAVVVSHSMTIGSFVNLIEPSIVLNPSVENGSVTRVSYENGVFHLEDLGNTSYRDSGSETELFPQRK